MAIPFPPSVPSTVSQTILSYLYTEYNDDANVQSFVDAYNAYSQGYLNYLNTLNIPIYSNGNITGALLDWVMEGIYGLRRPGLPTTGITAKGELNSYRFNRLEFNSSLPSKGGGYIATSDDIFKRIATWYFYRGDGYVFTTHWLKLRITRFLNFPNGTSGNIDNTYNVSVTYTGYGTATITIPNTPVATVFQSAVQGGVIELPVQKTWTIVT